MPTRASGGAAVALTCQLVPRAVMRVGVAKSGLLGDLRMCL